MRIGYNPYKDQKINDSEYFHQIIIPVFIPNQEGYFKDSFAILKLCIESLIDTIHDKTFVTIVNNGSDKVISNYLDSLFAEKKIHEVIHTENIGKLNAVLKGLAGNNIELVTISDSDVLFLPNWQNETTEVFAKVPKAGVVGIVPQFKMYENHCGNVVFDNLLSSKLQFIPVKNKEALIRFYDSIGWDRDYNQNYLEYALGLKIDSDLSVLIGSGHFVATYKKDIFSNIVTHIGYKMGASSEAYLDKLPLKKEYWRLTTYDNYAYHMGNVFESWMEDSKNNRVQSNNLKKNFHINKRQNKLLYFIKNRLFVKMFSVKWTIKLFLKYKKLPVGMIENY
ncbi:glycosyltransferase family A protein [Flavobacterium daemonense]|uniref:glycosyltransferase family A protein n=1 Tax=Flavobacterium daemonense TaxID=1393049 RepID=UPI001184D29B|nr:glycosyltransferase family 2 protein [Flavobacterium daemonense]KAF2333118.1 glycosyltransferase [Flavobacterium daemonense]